MSCVSYIECNLTFALKNSLHENRIYLYTKETHVPLKKFETGQCRSSSAKRHALDLDLDFLQN